jgi:iron complex outermembrane receptor protein
LADRSTYAALCGDSSWLSSIQTFEPETITDVEIGLKTGWTIAGIRGNFTGDIFRGKDKGYQVFQVFSGTGLSSIASGALLNEANLTIQGFEASLNANLFEGFNLGGDVAYTDINVDQVTLDASVAAAFQAAGRTAPSVVVAQQPTWQVNARFDYTIPAEILGGSLTLAADYHHQTSYASSDYRVPGYGVVNAKITLANFMGSPVDVSIYARNLLDKTYFSGPQSAAGGLGVFSYMVAPPRIVGASVRWRLGSDAERR